MVSASPNRSESGGSRVEPTVRLVPGVLLLALMAGMWLPAYAAPPPPPGGHIPLYQGGNNRAGYPPLNQQVAVPPRSGELPISFVVTTHPNPFRAATRFRFVTRAGERARVRVFSAQGKLVRELVSTSGGTAQQVVWDGRDQRGRRLPAALYLYRVDAGLRSARGKLVLVR